jgi:hypothetical protein
VHFCNISLRMRQWGIPKLPPAFTLVTCLAYFLILKMEVICSSKTSIDTQRTTRRYIPEDGTLQNIIYLNIYWIMWKWDQQVSAKRRYLFSRPHGVTTWTGCNINMQGHENPRSHTQVTYALCPCSLTSLRNVFPGIRPITNIPEMWEV